MGLYLVIFILKIHITILYCKLNENLVCIINSQTNKTTLAFWYFDMQWSLESLKIPVWWEGTPVLHLCEILSENPHKVERGFSPGHFLFCNKFNLWRIVRLCFIWINHSYTFITLSCHSCHRDGVLHGYAGSKNNWRF